MIKTFNNKAYVVVNQVIVSLLSLVTGKLIALFIKPDLYGDYVLELAIYTFIYSFFMSPYIQFYKATCGNLINKVSSIKYNKILIFKILISIASLYLCFNFYNSQFSISKFLLISLFLILTVFFRIELDKLNIQSKFEKFIKYSVAQPFLILITLFTLNNFRLFNDSTIVLWLSNLIGVFIILIEKFKAIKFNKGNRFYNKIIFEKYYRFSRPLMILAIWSWLSNYFDRYAIDYFLSTKDVGIYNANYSIGSKLLLLISPIFITILTPVVYGNHKTDFKKEVLNKYIKYFVVLSVIITVIVYFTTNLIGSLLLSDDYSDGFYLIFWICCAFFFYCLTLIFELFFYQKQKTYILLKSHIYSSIINVLGNIYLIPILGVFGASLATVFSFILRFVFVYINYKKVIK